MPSVNPSIIIVDDFGERIPVPETVTRFPKVKLIRTTEPRGVAGARIAGAEKVSFFSFFLFYFLCPC